MIDRLIPTLGFAWSMRAVTFMFLGLLIIGNLTIRSRLPPKSTPIAASQFLVPFKEPPFLFVALGSFFFFWGVFLPTNFIILQAQHDGMSLNLSGYILAILSAGRYYDPILDLWCASFRPILIFIVVSSVAFFQDGLEIVSDVSMS